MRSMVELTPADAIRLRNQHRQAGAGIRTPLAAVPDEELIANLIAHGQPRHAAEELRVNPQLRLAALRFWVDVGDAGKGDPAARERVDYMRECWTRMRAEELISDDPRRQHTDLIDPKELLG
ncbi:MAG TPA: hypothetical protein VF032_19515 [Thermoleophilaceae bacterium]